MGKPRVYLNSSCKNSAVDAEIRQLLCEKGFEGYSPCQRSAREESDFEIFRRNIAQISKADLMVVVLKDCGKDTTAELGIAYGLWACPPLALILTRNLKTLWSTMPWISLLS